VEVKIVDNSLFRWSYLATFCDIPYNGINPARPQPSTGIGYPKLIHRFATHC